MEKNNIKCPNCGHQFPVEDAFFNQAEERIRKEYEIKASERAEELNREKNDLKKAKEEIERWKKEEGEIFNKKLKEKLLEEKVRLTKETESEFLDKIKMLEEENNRRNLENKELKKKELELLRKEKEMAEKEEDLRLRLEKEMFEKRNEIAEEVRKQEAEKNELKVREYEKKLDDQKKLVEEMKRKAEQGSMQMQGEIQELVLEEILRNEYPFDLIDEVPKGVSGADVIQTVVNSYQQVCGKIIYESKRTKAFSDGWIDKLKEDQRNQQADIALIVTEVMPKELEKFGRKDGVWICNFNEVKAVSFVLREMILKAHSVKGAEVNKGDKMELLYNYLISDDFKHRVEAIVEGFSGLKSDLDKEKRAMQRIWKEREKQIEKVISNTVDMYGSIKGIAGNAVGSVKALELTAGDEEELF